jgi:hypothetical protein
VPQVEGSCFGQSRWPWPAGIGQQVPIVPTRAQETQAVSQAVSQQTPSAQKPESQSSFPCRQTLPFMTLPQLPAAHLIPGVQSMSVVQLVRQLEVPGVHE